MQQEASSKTDRFQNILSTLISDQVFWVKWRSSDQILKIHQISKRFSPKYTKSAKICEKNVFYGIPFVLSGRFGDLYRRVEDSVCIWETPSWHRSIFFKCRLYFYINLTKKGNNRDTKTAFITNHKKQMSHLMLLCISQS